jgi:uncharacterized protein (TIGR00661 family)
MVHCRLEMGFLDRQQVKFESILYRMMVPSPERAIAAAFYPGEPKSDRVEIVGPILRREVREIEPSVGDHLLVYFDARSKRLLEKVIEVLREIDIPVRIYGPKRVGKEGNLDFRPISNVPFLEDLASSRAVISTAGNQLIGESIHLGKPLLLLPEQALEQELNAMYVRRWGIGDWTTAPKLTPDFIRGFLARIDEMAARVPEYRRDGLGEALDALDRAIASLSDGR